ncbi:MAG: hypothetical protein ABW352_18615, partial [Polyangiales bacterium]
MEVDVVGVGLPVQHEAQRGLVLEAATLVRELARDVLGERGLGLDPRGGGEAEVFTQDAVDAAEATVGVALLHAGEDGVEGLARLALLEQREAEQAMAGRVIRALRHGLAIGVDGERERALVLDALEALAREAAQVGAAGEQVDDGA